MEKIEVINPGLLTTVQDRGRFGHQQSGVSVSGVMDPFAHRVANILCGNDDQNEAVLEISMMGPILKFHADAYIAITGGNLSPMIDGNPIKTWQSIIIKAGSTLSFGQLASGVRGYIGIHGGFDIPVVMGSKSTYARAKIGGFEGRALQKGDMLPYCVSDVSRQSPRQIPRQYLPRYERESVLRIVLGPQDDAFTDSGVQTLLTSPYKVTQQIDRMGYRLEGAVIEHKDKSDIISDGMTMGAVQVPGEGQPIILMADRQTTGGYTKIAAIIYADLYKVAQAQPGDTFRFEAIPVEKAQEIYRTWQNAFSIIADNLLPVDKTVKHYNIYANGAIYPMTIHETE